MSVTRTKTAGLILLVALVAAAVGYFAAAWRGSQLSSSSPTSGSAQPSAAPIFAATLPDLAGKHQKIEQWRGKVLVVNFWATWCAPCLEEIPEFIKLQNRYGEQGLQFVGIAIDQKDKIEAFAEQNGINYPILAGEANAIDLSRKAGNRLGALPYTLIIDRAGQVVATELGGLTEAKLERVIKPLF
ncbi:MAG: TlpA family protein disulfide reductase [Burkholderiales bacterium]|nr:TlpA family protein disulfide reductase [Burkholderiales bacterium]